MLTKKEPDRETVLTQNAIDFQQVALMCFANNSTYGAILE